MSLRFLLGRAGTGKTHRCLDEIAGHLRRDGEDGEPLILLVPEQATFQMERALLERLPRPGTTRAQVLSFRRLTQRVLQQAGGGELPLITELGKRMALRAILARLQPEFEIFRAAATKSGFIEHASRIIRELRAYRLDATALDDLAARRQEQQPVLAAKLRDLRRLLAAYEAYLAGRFNDPEGQLEVAAARVESASWLRDARIWIDGFAGFHPGERELLGALFGVARETTVALCLDGLRSPAEPPRPTDLFAETRETYRRLIDLAGRRGVAVEPPEVLDQAGVVPHRFRSAAALARIERFLFSPSPPAWRGPLDGQVCLVAAEDPRGEVEAAAAEILRLQREHRLRPRDIAVVVRRLDPYEPWIRRIFSAYGIPCFIDRRRAVTDHPLARLVRSAVEVVTADWPAEAFFRWLRSDLVPLERDQVDRLERYVQAHGISGCRAFTGRPWSYWRRPDPFSGPEAATDEERERLQEINAIREAAIGPLLPLQRRLAQETVPASAAARALYHLLEELQVPEQLARWRADALEAGDLERSRAHERVWDGLVDLLEQVHAVFGDDPVTPEEFRKVIETGLEQLDVGLIPPALDQVLVGSIDRSRQPDVQATLILGANEGGFPQAPPEDPVLHDSERQALDEMGVQLAPDSRRRLFDERYLVYIALTRPSRRLWVSWSRGDGRGGDGAPSAIVTRLLSLFPDLEQQAVGPMHDPARRDPRAFQHPRPLPGALVRRLRQAREDATPGSAASFAGPAGEAWLAAYRWLARHPGWGPRLERLLPALEEPRPVASLPGDLIRILSAPGRAGKGGKRIGAARERTSVSRLERYAVCPFLSFAADGLRLEDSSREPLDPRLIGSFIHTALKTVADRVDDDGSRWAELQEEDLRRLARDAVEGQKPALERSGLLASGRSRYVLERLTRRLEWVLGLLAEHARRGDFRPVATEVEFGTGRPGALPSLSVRAGSRSLELRGRIDRVDAARVDGDLWIRVIDYKNRTRSFSLPDVRHGLALQLLVYLAVAVESAPEWLGEEGRPAGAYYLATDEPLVEDSGDPASDLSHRQAASKLRGLTVADPGVIRAMDREVGGSSTLVQAGLTKEGRPAARTPTAPEPDLRLLLEYARLQAGRLAAGMARGDVAPRPYRDPSGHVPCTTCPYGSVCRFEGRWGRHRDLPSLSDREVWMEIREAVARGEGSER